MNKRIFFGIVCIVLIFLFLITLMLLTEEKETIDFLDSSVSAEDFNDFIDVMGGEKSFFICNIPNEQCMIVRRIR